MADLEAGIGTLTRLDPQSVDVIVVVAEPTPRSIDVAQRAVKVALRQRQRRVVVVANKLVDGDRLKMVDAFGSLQVVGVPADTAVDEADRIGVSVLDREPDSRAVVALDELADLIRT